MKKIIAIALTTVFYASLMTTAVMAEGDQVRGEEGQGDTVQACLYFGDCPYGTESPAH